MEWGLALSKNVNLIMKICGKKKCQNYAFFSKILKILQVFSIFNFSLKMKMIAKCSSKPCDCSGMGLLIDLYPIANERGVKNKHPDALSRAFGDLYCT